MRISGEQRREERGEGRGGEDERRSEEWGERREERGEEDRRRG